MTCEEARESMAAAWMGEMEDAPAAAFHLHLETCATCNAEMASLGALWERLGDLPAPEPGDALDARWEATLASLRPWRVREISMRRPRWQAATAATCLAIGVWIGASLPRGENSEMAKLREEVAGTREMVALALLQQQSATERLRGIDYTDRMKTMEPDVVAALIRAVSHDASVNVRLAAVDALTRVAARPDVVDSLTRALPQQDSPMVQAALIDYLIDAHDRQAVETLRQLAARPDLNPAVLERARFALGQLSR